MVPLHNVFVETYSFNFPNVSLQVNEIFRVKVKAQGCFLFKWELTLKTERFKFLIFFYSLREPIEPDQLRETICENVF